MNSNGALVTVASQILDQVADKLDRAQSAFNAGAITQEEYDKIVSYEHGRSNGVTSILKAIY